MAWKLMLSELIVLMLPMHCCQESSLLPLVELTSFTFEFIRFSTTPAGKTMSGKMQIDEAAIDEVSSLLWRCNSSLTTLTRASTLVNCEHGPLSSELC